MENQPLIALVGQLVFTMYKNQINECKVNNIHMSRNDITYHLQQCYLDQIEFIKLESLVFKTKQALLDSL